VPAGLHHFRRPWSDGSTALLLDGLALAAVKVVPFDGEHWEEAAAAYLAKAGKRPAR